MLSNRQPNPGARGAYERALREMQKPSPNGERAVGHLEAASRAGDVRADYALGTWYLHGSNVRRSVNKGFRMIAKAARAGIPEALFDLAVCCETGLGTRTSVRRAATLYVRAALLGDPEAPFEVGRMLYHGIGLARDRAQARVWLDFAERETKPRRETTERKTQPRRRESVKRGHPRFEAN